MLQPRRLISNALAGLALLLALAGCSSLPTDPNRPQTHALSNADTAATKLGKGTHKLLQAHPEPNGFHPLGSGVDALLVRIALAEQAERTLDVQYYIWHNDQTGRHLAYSLLRAADRGVRVRVLLDDVGTSGDDETLLSLSAHPNVEIRLFNPIASRSFRGLSMLGDMSRVNRRMHNKSFTADNQAAVVGGRNIGDEYFDASEDVAFGDLDVLMIGSVVSEVSQAFDRFWNAPQSVDIAALVGSHADRASLDSLRAQLNAFIDSQRNSPYVTQASKRLGEMVGAGSEGIYWGQAHLLYDDPDKISREPGDAEGQLLPQLGAAHMQVQRELLIVSPYFVPGKKGVAWLTGLVQHGVRVTVLTNSLAATDVSAVHSGYQRYREALLEGGVRLYEVMPDAISKQYAKRKKKMLGASRASLHAKTFVFDQQAVFIGSLNLDPRSVQLNTEIGVVCESPALAADVAGGIEKLLDDVAWRLERKVDESGSAHIEWVETGDEGELRYTTEPQASSWRRLSAWFLGLLPIESQL